MGTQNPIQVGAAVAPNGAGKKSAPLQLDTVGALLTGKANQSSLNNAAAAAKIVSTTARRICKVIVNTAPSAASGVYDAATTGACTAANLVFSIPLAVGVYDVDFPLTAGLGLLVGTAGVVSLSFQ